MEKSWATGAASGMTSSVVSPTERSPSSADPKLHSGSSLPSLAPGDCQTSRQERMTPDRSRYAPQRAMLAIQSGLDTGQKCTQCANSARYTRLRTGLIAGILPITPLHCLQAVSSGAELELGGLPSGGACDPVGVKPPTQGFTRNGEKKTPGVLLVNNNHLGTSPTRWSPH